ncbi:MAG: hypothetical protein IPG32_15740 [Saprospirales bacterium]|nr:hypothetical protein [Saprospirales bacterium]
MKTLRQMEQLLGELENSRDGRASFLGCYCLMTENMLSAVEQGEFRDNSWMRNFIDHFAAYYLRGFEKYEKDKERAPKVWVLAHDHAARDSCATIQKLLLGVNAHINFDLALTVVDLLGPEWAELDEDQRSIRFADYCHVNEIIGETIDKVQDQILETDSRGMELLDTYLGRLDEWLISRLIRAWRSEVWEQAGAMLVATEEAQRAGQISALEEKTLLRGEAILFKNGVRSLNDLF